VVSGAKILPRVTARRVGAVEERPTIVEVLSSYLNRADKNLESRLGTKIIHTVRCYDSLVESADENLDYSPQKAIADLLGDDDNEHHPAILAALEQCVLGELGRRQEVLQSAEMTAVEV